MSFFSTASSSGFSSSRRNLGGSPQDAGYVGLRLNSDLDQLQSSYRPYRDEPESEEDADTECGLPPPPMTFQSLSRSGMLQLDGNGDGRGGARGAPDPSGVFIHTVPESSKSRWSHIDDLDSFFKKVYSYHQKHGFKVMMLQVRKATYFLLLYCGSKAARILT